MNRTRKRTPLSEEHKAAIKKKLTGRKLSQEQRDKISLGVRNTRWKNHIKTTPLNKEERIRFRNTMQKAIFERDNYTCQLCLQVGGKLQVDHIQSWAEYVEQRFNMDNCRTLCMDCHYLITYGKPKPQDVMWGHNLKERMVS